MVSITQFAGLRSPKRTDGRPLLNEVFTNYSFGQRASFGAQSMTEAKKEFWKWFKTKPELNSPVTARVNDTIKQVDFFAPDGRPLGRNKRMEAERFWEENFVDERLKSIWFDAICTGAGFGWKGTLKEEQLKELAKRMAPFIAKKTGCEIKEAETSLYLKSIDEDLRIPRKFDYIASSTMDVVHDDHTVQGFKQIVGTKSVNYNVNEILHFKFLDIDGKVDGYSPVESLSAEMILLWFIKENMIAYIRNGGYPKKIFSLPDEQANSNNHEFLINKLQEYNAVENRNGNLVFTGKVDVMDLSEKIRDMEYEKLELFVVSNIAYALQMPVSRIPYLIGKAQSTDAGGLAESGYWSMIEADQRKIENILNTQLCRKMGFIVRFRKHYKLDDLRETQALTMKADAVTKLQSIFNTYGKQLTTKKIATMMDLNDDDFEDIKDQPILQSQRNGLMGQNLLNNTQLEGDQMVKRAAKRAEQVNKPSNTGDLGN